jgi:3-mercaptopyruvate sulfurtransferase SseA
LDDDQERNSAVNLAQCDEREYVVGHPQVEILHGGLQAWKAEGKPLTTEGRTPAKRVFSPKIDDSLMVSCRRPRDSVEN